MAHRSRRDAFTLIELLVVLSIIAALMGLLIPGIMLVRRNAAKARAANEIAQIQAALESFRNLNGTYPESTGAADDYADEFEPTAGSPRAYDAGISWEKVGSYLKGQLASANGDILGKISVGASGARTFYVDPWGQPYRYRPSRFYPFSAGATVAIDSDDPPNPDTYQVWSAGPDRDDDGGLGDDVMSWKKR